MSHKMLRPFMLSVRIILLYPISKGNYSNYKTINILIDLLIIMIIID